MFDIITDSACDLTLDTAKQLGIEVVPFYVSLDGEHYRKEGLEIPVRDFYQFMVDNPAAYPKTSLASIEDFEKTFRAHAEAGRAVLCLVFTGKMSGCVGSARNARDLVLEDYPDARIEVIDSAAATGIHHGGKCRGHAGCRLHLGRDCDLVGSRKIHQPDLLHRG